MATLTYQAQLEEVQTLISAIMTGGQAYSNHGRSFTKADLSVLHEREIYLRRMAAREAAGGIAVVGGTPVDE